MTKVFKHQLDISPEFAAAYFFNHEIIQLNEQIDQLNLKKQLFQKMLDKVKKDLCPTCSGEGKYRINDKDGSELIVCPDCNGTGLIKE